MSNEDHYAKFLAAASAFFEGYAEGVRKTGGALPAFVLCTQTDDNGGLMRISNLLEPDQQNRFLLLSLKAEMERVQ